MFDKSDIQTIKDDTKRKKLEKQEQINKERNDKLVINEYKDALAYAVSEIYNALPEVARIINENGLKWPRKAKIGVLKLKTIRCAELLELNMNRNCEVGGGSIMHLLIADDGRCYAQMEGGRWGWGETTYSDLFVAPNPRELTKNFINDSTGLASVTHGIVTISELCADAHVVYYNGGNGGSQSQGVINGAPYSKDIIKKNVKGFLMDFISKLETQ